MPVSILSLLKSSTVLWLIGVSYDGPKEHRDLSVKTICADSYDYGMSEVDSCEKLVQFVTPTLPGASSHPEFLTKYPWLHTALYGRSLDKTDPVRIKAAEQRFKELKCSEHYADYEKQYASLSTKDLLNYVNKDIMARIAQHNADQKIEDERKKVCGSRKLLELQGEHELGEHVRYSLRGSGHQN